MKRGPMHFVFSSILIFLFRFRTEEARETVAETKYERNERASERRAHTHFLLVLPRLYCGACVPQTTQPPAHDKHCTSIAHVVLSGVHSIVHRVIKSKMQTRKIQMKRTQREAATRERQTVDKGKVLFQFRYCIMTVPPKSPFRLLLLHVRSSVRPSGGPCVRVFVLFHFFFLNSISSCVRSLHRCKLKTDRT